MINFNGMPTENHQNRTFVLEPEDLIEDVFEKAMCHWILCHARKSLHNVLIHF
jgi:hypothetical protein